MSGAQISRRTALVAAAAAMPLATPAIAQGIRRLRLVATWPRGLPGLWDGAARFADRVTRLSDGDMVVQAFAAGEEMAAFDVFDAVRAGDADFYHGAEYYWQGRTAAFNFFTTVPFGFTAREQSGWIRHGGGQALWDELAGSFGLKGLMCGNTGVQMGGWYDRPILSLADMKGLKIRIPGIAADIFRALGSEPVSLPGGAIPAALFSGEINAVEWVGPYNDLDFGIQKVLRHYMYPGFHEPGTTASLGINLALWRRLSARERAIVETAAMVENRLMPAQYAAHSGPALTQLRAEYGTEVLRFPDSLYSEVARLSEEVIRDIGRQDAFADRCVQSFLSYRAALLGPARDMTSHFMETRERALANWQVQSVPLDEIAD